MKENVPGKSGKGSARNRTSKPISSVSPSQDSDSGTKKEPSGPSAPIPGLTKKTRPELALLAESIGLSVSLEDRRTDLIERIRAAMSHSGKKKEEDLRARGRTVEPPAPTLIETPPPIPHEEKAPSLHSSVRQAGGWKDFLDIPYEPARRERGHFVTILPLSPFRIMAFFAFDRGSDTSLAGRVDSSGLVLKVRDVTGAVARNEKGAEPMADHVFDIMTGMANRWNIPLWSSHRWIEAWLGYYANGSFHTLARSKRIRTPRGGPSPRTGSLFHLKETAFAMYSPMEGHGRDTIPRYHIKLPTSHEIPSSQRNT